MSIQTLTVLEVVYVVIIPAQPSPAQTLGEVQALNLGNSDGASA